MRERAGEGRAVTLGRQAEPPRLLLEGRAHQHCRYAVVPEHRLVQRPRTQHPLCVESRLRRLGVLRALGGRELAAMAGALIQARRRQVPVLLDGFVCGAAAACLQVARADALGHCQAAHRSAEPGHERLLAKLGMEPLLQMNMRLGEASGAVLAVGLVRGALACHSEMATFGDAGVSGKNA